MYGYQNGQNQQYQNYQGYQQQQDPNQYRRDSYSSHQMSQGGQQFEQYEYQNQQTPESRDFRNYGSEKPIMDIPQAEDYSYDRRHMKDTFNAQEQESSEDGSEEYESSSGEEESENSEESEASETNDNQKLSDEINEIVQPENEKVTPVQDGYDPILSIQNIGDIKEVKFEMASMSKDIDDLCKRLKKFRMPDLEESKISQTGTQSMAPTQDFENASQFQSTNFNHTQTQQTLKQTKPKLLSTQNLSFESFHNSQLNQNSTIQGSTAFNHTTTRSRNLPANLPKNPTRKKRNSVYDEILSSNSSRKDKFAQFKDSYFGKNDPVHRAPNTRNGYGNVNYGDYGSKNVNDRFLRR